MMFTNGKTKETEMAKKDAKPNEQAAPAAGGEAAPKVAKPVTKTQFTFVKDPDEKAKLAPQARVIVATLKELQTAPRDHLVKVLSDGRLKTRQPVERIVGYYQKALETQGLIKIEKLAA